MRTVSRTARAIASCSPPFTSTSAPGRFASSTGKVTRPDVREHMLAGLRSPDPALQLVGHRLALEAPPGDPEVTATAFHLLEGLPMTASSEVPGRIAACLRAERLLVLLLERQDGGPDVRKGIAGFRHRVARHDPWLAECAAKALAGLGRTATDAPPIRHRSGAFSHEPPCTIPRSPSADDPRPAMTSPADILRTHSDLAVALALPLGLSIALGLVGLVLRAAGASLRPVLLIAILTAPLCGAFLVAGLVRARVPSAPITPGRGLVVADGRFAQPELAFGIGVDASQARDARPVFPGLLDAAEAAQLAIPDTGESVLVAQFSTTDAAKAAAGQYWTLFRAQDTSGSAAAGWRGRRGPQGDRFEMRLTGRILRVWTAPDAATCAARRAALESMPGGLD